VADAIVFLPLPARRALRRLSRAFSGARLEVERRGPIRRPVRATLHVDGATVSMHVLTDAELSAELRARRDPGLDPLGALRLADSAWASRVAEATGGTLREGGADAVRRGLALCALMGRWQAEIDSWEGREREPERLLSWLRRHDADGALSEAERAWLLAPVGEAKLETWVTGLRQALASHAYALDAVASPDETDVPTLLHALGYLADELPPLRLRRGAEAHLR